MSSILTNISALAGLQTLRSISNDLQRTQGEVSSGYRVKTVSDDVAYWSISTTMRSQNKALSAVSDTIGVGQAVLDTTYAGMNQVLSYMDEIKSLVVTAANEAPAETNNVMRDWEADPIYDQSTLGKVDRHMRQLFTMIQGVVDSTSFNGVNLLKIEKDGPSIDGSIRFVTGIQGAKIQTTDLSLKDTVMINYDRDGDYLVSEPGAEKQGFIDGKYQFVWPDLPATWYNATADNVYTNSDIYVMRYSILNYAVTPGYADRPLNDYFNSFLDGIDSRIASIRFGMASVGAIQNSLNLSGSLVELRSDNIDLGVSRLVDADMEEASARMTALQTQQQLAVQALQISNENPSRLLALFN